jgi:hypothetical protein
VALFAEGDRTRLTLANGEFTDNGMGVQLAVSASAKISASKFATNTIHLEASSSAQVSVDTSEFRRSGNGLGVFVTDGAFGQFTKCEFAEEPKSGLACDSRVEIVNSTVKDCSTCGLFFFGTCQATVTNCEISENASCGIQIMGGAIEVRDGKIENHTIFGIHVDGGAAFKESGVTFTSNSMMDINRE